ncbi:mannitol dehydrogenase family protein [Pelagibacterium lentulum]|uniref:Mannitol dehydrogenase n=1 Tax=Pelagibacterium lentulum TaxID=2029865 RepID=A0A916RMC9_9HYPH|nr:mannitol dehydrogenase family protein [Pelagibacterium lentulum]GGA62008.1 mannitol dehydrogenase [Pelagibacterium lentulum]
MEHLSANSKLPDSVTSAGYAPDRHGVGIVHLGLGAFHRAHQAWYTDSAIAAAGGNWRILGVSLRTADAANALNLQDGRYCLIERGASRDTAQVIDALKGVLYAPEQGKELLAALSAETTRIVSLTITEKGYCRDVATGGLDRNNVSIVADLAGEKAYPVSAIGWIVKGLEARRAAGTKPFTVLSCDNLPDNGAVLRRVVLEFAEQVSSELRSWISENTSFPSTMVDRITPAQTTETRALAQRLCGYEDLAAIETEPFSQWVLEDNFCNGRPLWEKGGALFVSDIAAYETMKLRMLNGTHSMLAYAGALSDKIYVRDVMADPVLRSAVVRHMKVASRTVPPVPGVDLDSYADQLCTRFENPNIAHATRQIAMDGTQKLPQRIFAPAVEILADGLAGLAPFAFATACWMAFVVRNLATLSDPRADEIRSAIAGLQEPSDMVKAFIALPGLMPDALSGSAEWAGLVESLLVGLFDKGVQATSQTL